MPTKCQVRKNTFLSSKVLAFHYGEITAFQRLTAEVRDLRAQRFDSSRGEGGGVASFTRLFGIFSAAHLPETNFDFFSPSAREKICLSIQLNYANNQKRTIGK